MQYSSAGWTLLKSRIIATTHLRIFVALGLQIFCGLPQHRIFASSQLRLSRFSETLSAASHLCIFATSAIQIFSNPLRSFASSHLRGIGSGDMAWASSVPHLRNFSYPDFLKPSPQLRIFASSRYWVCSYCGGFHSFTSSHLHISTSSHLRNFDHPDFLKPSPQLRIFASSRHWGCRYCVGFSSNASLHLRIFTTSQLRLSRFSEILSTASHLRTFTILKKEKK